MYIHINENGVITLEDYQNMKSFSIVDDSNGSHLADLDPMSEPAEDNHYWLDADTVIRLSPAGLDPVWVNGFQDMLKAAEPHGYSDIENNRVKAHVGSLPE